MERNDKKYDVIVVGAGNGGLVAAAKLAQSGKKTLLIEKQDTPGGVAYSFLRGRFEFEISLHELCGVGSEDSPGSTRRLLNSLGVYPEWVPSKELFRVIGEYSDGGKMDVTLPAGEEEFYSALIAIDPKNERAILRLKKIAMPLFKLFGYLKERRGRLLRAAYYFIKYGAFPAKKVFLSLGLSQKIIDVLSTYWSYLGMDLNNLTFYHYITMLYGYVVDGVYLPAHTSGALSYMLLEAFLKNGGEAIFNREVTAINVEDNHVTGVSAGEEYLAPYVIFNGNPAVAYSKLLKPLPERKIFTQREFSVRPFVVYLGLNRSAEQLGIKNYSVFLPGRRTPEEEFESMRSIKDNGFLISVCPSLLYPASEEGSCILTLTTLYSSNCWGEVGEEEYFSLKEEVAARLISRFEKETGARLRGYIEELEIATPLTFYRFASLPQGCGYGYAMTISDNVLARVMAGNEVSIKGLSFCGGSCRYGNGYNMSQKSGYDAAEAVLKEDK